MNQRRGVAAAREQNVEEVRQLYLLVPEDLALLETVRGDEHRLTLALQLVWARTARVLDPDLASLPSMVIQAVADQLALEPEILAGYRSGSATRATDSALIRQHLGVRPFTSEDGARLHDFLREKVAQTGNTAALLDAAEEWLVKEGVLLDFINWTLLPQLGQYPHGAITGRGEILVPPTEPGDKPIILRPDDRPKEVRIRRAKPRLLVP